MTNSKKCIVIPVPRAKVYMIHLLQVINLRLPREGDRLKGYGYVEFEDRESLIDAMNIPDLVSGSSFCFFTLQVIVGWRCVRFL